MDMSEAPCVHEPLSPAVQRCCSARSRIFIETAQALLPQISPDTDPSQLTATQIRIILKESGHLYETKLTAAAAYRYAMPDPSTRQGIKDYIACVLHGMTVEAINKRDGAALLAGARIALAGLKYAPSPSKQKANIDFSAENEAQQPA
jgi:hypothetical protein